MPATASNQSSPGAAAEPSRNGSVNRELIVVFSIFVIAAVLNLAFESQRMVLGLYILPTLYSAYHYGRRHAVLTAVFSVFLVVLLGFLNPAIMQNRLQIAVQEVWFDVAAWSGLLVVTAYAMGTMYERNAAQLRDLRQSYQGILLILQHITSDQKYSQDHPYRVSMCATQIAEEMSLPRDRVEDVRSCALLHEIERLGISRNLLEQAAGLTDSSGMPVASKGETSGSLQRIVAILRAYEDARKSEYTGEKLSQLPLEARILHVADVYDSLTSARESRISPSEAVERIAQRAGLEYDDVVVEAFVRLYRRRATGAVMTAVPVS